MVGADVSARDPAPAEKAPQDLADDHDLRLHRAKQRCREVLYQGQLRFIDGFCSHPNDKEMVIYLTGKHEPVRPCDLTFPEKIT